MKNVEKLTAAQEKVYSAFKKDVSEGLKKKGDKKEKKTATNDKKKTKQFAHQGQSVISADGNVNKRQKSSEDEAVASKYASQLTYGGGKYAQNRMDGSTNKYGEIIRNQGVKDESGSGAESGGAKNNKKDNNDIISEEFDKNDNTLSHTYDKNGKLIAEGFGKSGKDNDDIINKEFGKKDNTLSHTYDQDGKLTAAGFEKDGKGGSEGENNETVEQMNQVRQAIDQTSGPDKDGENGSPAQNPETGRGEGQNPLVGLREELREVAKQREKLMKKRSGFARRFRNNEKLDDEIKRLNEEHDKLSNDVKALEPTPLRETVSKDLRALSDQLGESRRKYIQKDHAMDQNSSLFKKVFGAGKRSEHGDITGEFEMTQAQYEEDLKKYYDAIIAEELGDSADEDDRRILANALNVGELASISALRKEEKFSGSSFESLRDGYVKLVERYNRLPLRQKIYIGGAFVGVGVLAGGVGTAAAAAGGAMALRRAFGFSAATVGFKSMFEGIADKTRMKKAESDAAGFTDQLRTEQNADERAQQIENFVSNRIDALDKKFQDQKDWQKRRWWMAGASALATFGAARYLVGLAGGGDSTTEAVSKDTAVEQGAGQGTTPPKVASPVESMGADRPDASADNPAQQDPVSHEAETMLDTDEQTSSAELSEKLRGGNADVGTVAANADQMQQQESPQSDADSEKVDDQGGAEDTGSETTPGSVADQTDQADQADQSPSVSDIESNDDEATVEPADQPQQELPKSETAPEELVTQADQSSASQVEPGPPGSHYTPTMNYYYDTWNISDAAKGIHEVAKGDTLWSMIEARMASGHYLEGLDEGQKTHLIDALKDKFTAMSSEQLKEDIGISSGNIDRLAIGEKINLGAVIGDPDILPNALHEAGVLSEADAAQIIENNEVIADYAAKHPDVMMTEAKIDEILKEHASSDSSVAAEVRSSVESEVASSSSDVGEVMMIEKGGSIEGSIIDYLESHGMSSATAGREAHLMTLDFADKAGVKMSELDLVHPGDKVSIVPDPQRSGGFILSGLHAEGGVNVSLEESSASNASPTAVEAPPVAVPKEVVDISEMSPDNSQVNGLRPLAEMMSHSDKRFVEMNEKLGQSLDEARQQLSAYESKMEKLKEFIDTGDPQSPEVVEAQKELTQAQEKFSISEQQIAQAQETFDKNAAEIAAHDLDSAGQPEQGSADSASVEGPGVPENLPVSDDVSLEDDGVSVQETAGESPDQEESDSDEDDDKSQKETIAGEDPAGEDSAAEDDGKTPPESSHVDEGAESDSDVKDLADNAQKVSPGEYYASLSPDEQQTIKEAILKSEERLFGDHKELLLEPAISAFVTTEDMKDLSKEQLTELQKYYTSRVAEFPELAYSAKNPITLGDLISSAEIKIYSKEHP